MGSLGLQEIIFILLLALLIFGPKRLPEIGRTLGKGMAEFRKASNDLKRTINAELALDEDEQTRHPRRIEPPASLVQAIAPLAASQEPPAGTVAQRTWENPIAPAPLSDAPLEPAAPAASPAPGTSPAPEPQPSVSPVEPS